MWLVRSRMGMWENKAWEKNEQYLSNQKWRNRQEASAKGRTIRRNIPYAAEKGTAKVLCWQLDFNRKRREGLSGRYEHCQQADIIHTREWRRSAKREREQQEDEENHFSMFDLIRQNTQKNKNLCYRKQVFYHRDNYFPVFQPTCFFEEEEKNQLQFFPFFNLSV